ncbi:hypothetical protein, partial [Aporhodopirellula aestuarii]
MLFSRRGITPLVAALFLLFLSTSTTLNGQDADAPANSAAMALYADAANFQTNGAVELAIDNWKEFLSEYPQHKLA